MKSHKENFFLLFYHHCEFFFLFPHVVSQLFILRSSEHSLHFLRLLLELFDSNYISLNFVFNNSHSSVTYLVGRQKLVELCEVAVGLKNVEQVKS